MKYHFGGNYKRIKDTTYYVSKTGVIKNLNGKTLKTYTVKGKFLSVFPFTKGIQTSRFVHKIVYLTFVGPIPKGHVVKPIDGNYKNVNLKNLYLKKSIDKRSKGINKSLKMNREEMIALLKKGVSVNDIAKIFDCNYHKVYFTIKSALGDDIKKTVTRKASLSKRLSNRQEVIDLPNEIWLSCGPNEEISNFGRVIGPTGKVKTKKAPDYKVKTYFGKVIKRESSILDKVVERKPPSAKSLANRQKVIDLPGEIWTAYGNNEEISNMGRFIGSKGKIKKEKVPIRTVKYYFWKNNHET